MSRRLGSLSGLGSGGGAAAPDLTPPSTPAPVSLASGSTSLGSTLVGSWSASVTVAATVTASSGGAVTATVTGSGAGPYSVSIASGLADSRTYAVRLRGTGADGQVADVVLAVAVRPATTGTLGWTTLADYDFTTIDTAAGTTATSGSLALTVGGGAFLTLEGISGSGVGSITPTNGQGVVISAQGTRAFLVNVNWSGLGVSNVNRRIFSVDWEYEPITITTSSQSNAMMVSSVSGASSDSNFGARMAWASGPSWNISARSYNAGVANAGTEISTPTTIPARHSCSLIRIPEGIEVAQSLAALPADPDAHTYVGRRRSLTDSWGTLGGALILGTAPKAAFSLVCASGTSEVRVRRLRIMAQGVV